ncbi:NRDE protein (macronuclear) [Tetrahymena thermophila SB210]|uniref:NRDE protein n=1 Tax=Tetrahymena thermophila (strain SB210) TaxID=312017 RepID=I7M773_TETTS|nr:NRDE protein [Tetrahymena thermophila SB210]EAR89984.2 NRDE protein [Tetrahymena thermophila SB210]|eukprot:XP_001010229.2 NRDE protein [Tetrahymena thermophila SB210]
MCITFFYIPKNQNEKFILSFNRDEGMKKKTSILNYFEEDTNILAGRDLEGKGTWCGINKSTGIVAFLTNYDTQNYHDISDIKYGRGNLTYRFLKSEFGSCSHETINQKIYEGMNTILKELNQYNAFNLVIGSLVTNTFYYICNPYNQKLNITPKPQLLEQGKAYGLTNTDIHTLWPKTEYGLKIFNEILLKYQNNSENVNNIEQNHYVQDQSIIEDLQKLMFDQTIFNEDPESESPILVKQYFSKYCKKERGTVSSCYIVIDSKLKGIYQELYMVKEDFTQLIADPIKTVFYL